jgi:hypothetical protein
MEKAKRFEKLLREVEAFCPAGYKYKISRELEVGI